LADSLEALVFDIGGVLIDVDFGRALARWASAAGMPAETLAPRFRRDAAYCAHECGVLDHAGYFAHLRAVLGVQLGDEAMLAGWNAALGDPLPGAEPLLRRLAQEFPLYAFTNTNPAHLGHLTPRYRQLLSPFRKVFTSCELGARKPEPQAFARLAAAIGVAPETLLFFDDLEENVAGARAAGLQAFRVTRAEQIEAISEAVGRARKAR
jgi:HAD superfamily hydrolase (TIGR01509 family)